MAASRAPAGRTAPAGAVATGAPVAVAGAPVAAGVDVGGTKALAVACDAGGQVLAEARAVVPRGAGAVVAALAGLVGRVARAVEAYDVRFVGAGVGLPGLVDRSGVLRASPHLPYLVGADLAGPIGAAAGGPVVFDNDATFAMEAELRAGAARGCTDALFVSLGTGIGGAVVAAGQVQRGRHGYAGEFGHIPLDPAGPPCVCGRRGCWERHCSGTALVRVAAELGLQARRGEQVVAAARAGDPAARQAVAHTARWLGIGLAALVAALDPELVVVGGGFGAEAALLLPGATAALAEHLALAPRRPLPRLVPAAFGPRAGALGAALVALAAAGAGDDAAAGRPGEA